MFIVIDLSKEPPTPDQIRAMTECYRIMHFPDLDAGDGHEIASVIAQAIRQHTSQSYCNIRIGGYPKPSDGELADLERQARAIVADPGEETGLLLQTLRENADLLHDIIRSLSTKLRIANQALALHTVKPSGMGTENERWRCHLCGREAPRSAEIEHVDNCPLI